MDLQTIKHTTNSSYFKVFIYSTNFHQSNASRAADSLDCPDTKELSYFLRARISEVFRLASHVDIHTGFSDESDYLHEI